MNTHDGYKKQTLDNTLVLLAGGGHKALSDFAMSNSYVKISGDTMTGVLHMKAQQYADTANTGALELANSDIYGVNSIKFADLCDAAAEGLQWYRDATHIDTMWVKNGVMYFTPNREWNKTATNYVILHHGNVGLYTGGSGNLTANAAQGTNGNVYLTLKAADTYFKHNIVGEGSVGVTSDANGKIIITGDTFPYHFNIGNSSTENTWIQFATIATTAGDSTLRTVFFTLLFSNNECLEHSSFILTCAIRRTSTSQCSSDFIYTPLGTSLPKTIRLVSDDNKTFKCYIQCNANTYNGYYQVTKLGERMTNNNDTTITYSNTLTNTEPTGSVLQKDAVRSYDSDTYATTIAVTDKSTHSSSAQSYWIPMVSTYNGNASVYGSTDFFMYRSSNANYLNIGKAGITSGITFHHVNESSGAYGDLVSSACTAQRQWILPNASGTIALTSDIYNKTDSDARYVLKSGDTMTGGLSLKATDIDASKTNNNISSTQWPSTMNVIDNANRIMTRVESIVESNGNISLYMYVRQYDTSGNQIAQKGLKYTMAKDGAGTWTVNDAPSFRTALGLGSIATYASSDFVKKTGDTMTGNLIWASGAPYIKMATDSSNAKAFYWTNTSNGPIAAIMYHNTAQNLIFNPCTNEVSDIWTDAAGKYSLFVGKNKFTYNACPVVLHKDMSNSDITGESGTFFFSGAGTLYSGEDYVGYQVGDDKDKWQMVSYAANLRWRQNDTGGTNSANWGAFKTILDSDNSSISGGGSTWGSSITVKINGTSKTLTVPSDPSGNFVKKTGDTMSGSLTINNDGGLRIYDTSITHDTWFGWATYNENDYFVCYAYENKYWPMTFGTHANAITSGGLCFSGTDGGGKWGIGTLSPAYKFDVQGTGQFTGQLKLSVAQGTAPLAITSTTLCTNLNADLLDGLHSSSFMQNYNWGSQTINANSLTGSGAHRLSGSGSNFPVTNPNYGQMLTVFGGGDTVTQLYFPYDSSTAWLRSGNPLHSSGSGTWRAWRQIAFKDEIVSFSGTVNRFAYYNTTSSIASTSNISIMNSATNNVGAIQQGIRIGGQCYGNTASALRSGVVGNITYGDGGPQIIFSSGMNDNDDSMQSGAIIFTTHNNASYGGGYGFHFVGRGEVITRDGSQVTLGDTAGVAVISDIFGVKDRMYFYKPNADNATGAIYLKYANSALSVTGPFMVSTGQYNGLRFINGSGLTVNNSNDKGITLINGYFRFTNADEWDYSKWAGLGYDSTNKIINLGIPGDGTVFQKNSAVNKDGTLKLVNIKYIKLDGASGDTYTVYHTGNLSLSNYASSGHNHDDRYVKKVGDTMTGNLSIKQNSADLTQTNNGLSSGTVLYPGFRTADKNNKINAQFIGIINYTSGRSAFRASAMQYDSSGNKIKDVGLGYTINKDGTGYWEVNDAPAFRTAIGLGSITTYSSDDFVKKIGDTMTGALTIKKSISGTSWATDSGSLKITTNEASNPYVLGLAVNSDGYGEIQTSQVTVGYKPLILQKKGGVVGIKTSSPDTSASLYASGTIMSDSNFIVKTPGIDLSASDNGVSNTNWPGLFIKDKEGRTSVQYLAGTYANGDNRMFLTVRNYNTSGNEVCNKGLGLTVNKSGNGTWWVSEPASFRAALEIGSIYPLNLTTATANRFAYFSSTTAITSTAYMAYIPNVTVTTNSISRIQNGFRIWGQTYGNTASQLLSGIAGKFSYGDGGPQIQFGTGASGGQQGALIYTDHDCGYSAGVAWAFVSDQPDWNVQSKRFVAWDSVTIGYRASSSACYKTNTSYGLYNAGTTYLGGNISVGSTTLVSNLNADMLDGYHASSFLTSQDHYKTSPGAGTAGSSTATSGGSFEIPYVTINANGHVTGYGTHTHTVHELFNYYTSRPSSANLNADGSGKLRHFKATSSMTTANGHPGADGHILWFSWDNTGGYDAQLIIPTSASNTSRYLMYRGQNGSNTWGDWQIVVNQTLLTSTLQNYAYISGGTIHIGDNTITPSTGTSGAYLPLAGGTMDGTAGIQFSNFESNSKRWFYGGTHNCGWKYDYSGNKALIISSGTQSSSSICLWAGRTTSLNDSSGQWSSVTPSLAAKGNCVTINGQPQTSNPLSIYGGSLGTVIRIASTTTYACINYNQSSGAAWSAGSNSSSQFYFWNGTKSATVAYFDVNGALTCSGVVYKGLTSPGDYVFTCDGSYIAKSSLGGGSSGITISSVTLASTSYYPIMVTGTGSKTTAYIANPSSGAKFYATSSGVFFTSDAQLKTNISRYFVNREISENPVRKFDWKNGEGRNVVGFIAQEVEQWCPEAVNIDEFGYKSLNYNATLSALCGYLFDKVKELESTIKELRSQLNANKC